MIDRAIVFIDGNNFYHALKAIGVTDLGRLDYAKISAKIAGPAREWRATRYYVGQVNQAESPRLYADQRRFFAALVATDARISHYVGRLETRYVENEAATELLELLRSLPMKIDLSVYRKLDALGRRHQRTAVKVEKAVDVMIAVDMVSLARQDAFDSAYLFSADGDLTPAVEEVRRVGKRAYIASPRRGAQLAATANTYIKLDQLWFADCRM